MNVGYIRQEKNCFKMIDKLKYLFAVIDVYKYAQGYVFNLPMLYKGKKQDKILKNLFKQIKNIKVDKIVLSENIIDKVLLKRIEDEVLMRGIEIFNGRRLMFDMSYELLEYILKLQGVQINKEDVFFLIKKDNNLDVQFLERFVQNCKTVNIITDDIERFKKIQDNLYEKENILITVSNNKAKSLKRAKYIFNINMNKKDIDKYTINRNSIIVNFKENIKYNSRMFCGINVNYFKINLPDEYIEQIEQILDPGEFDNAKLYEVILNKKVEMEKKKITMMTKGELVKHKKIVNDIIKKDDIKIIDLIGNNGIIDKKEIIQNYQKVI